MSLITSLLYTTPLLATASEADNPTIVMAGVLMSLVIIYLASTIGGEICARMNLPSVLGQLLGGLIVGISAFHLLVFPDGGGDSTNSAMMGFLEATAGLSLDGAATIFQIDSEVISTMAEIGVVILLFEIGLESNLQELLKVGLQSTVVAVVGVATPFIAGTLGLIALFNVPTVPAIFAGAALTATSIGITAKVLEELQRLKSKEGQIIIGAAVLDDILGIIVLAVVAGLAKTGEVQLTNVLYLIISAVAFLVGSILLGRWSSPYFVKLVDELKTRGQLLVPALIFAFILAYIATIIKLEAILGAFTAGLVLAETQKCRELKNQVTPIADVLVPIFFVVVSAKTNIGVLNPAIPENREGLIMASFLIAIAIIGKIVSGFTVFGQPGTNKLAIGIGMIPRGEVGLVFAGIGSASGILPSSLDAAIIVMVIVTTFIAPPLLSLVFREPTKVSAVQLRE
ncbi:MAG: cation:proton antiporter [Scytonema sp. PMC 1069.18]|nr:cation:proton antiporter [Scytonema sp. PMC 1069.18]MEC4881579.1 cation:proton antiporter [Scytonema sp. PMC 1070.18]